jgi:hypothetical protein
VKFYFWEEFKDIKTIYLVLLPKEFEVIKNHSFKFLPERFFGKKRKISIIFDEEYAIRIASEKNNFPKNTTQLNIVRMLYNTEHLTTIAPTRHHSFTVLPEGKILQFNAGIIGLIERIHLISLP